MILILIRKRIIFIIPLSAIQLHTKDVDYSNNSTLGFPLRKLEFRHSSVILRANRWSLMLLKLKVNLFRYSADI